MDSSAAFFYALTWAPFSPLINAPDFTPVAFPTKAELLMFRGTARQALALDSASTVWEISVPRKTPSSSLRPRAIETCAPLRVAGVCCNDLVAFVWTHEGATYAWGMDPNEDGVIGIPGVFECRQPTAVEALKACRVIQIAVGKTHCAAIDGTPYADQGRLYSWGSGDFGQLGSPSFTEHLSPPQLVESARILRCKRVVCGDTFTAVCTATGCLYIFGVIGSHMQRRRGQVRHTALLQRLLLNQSLMCSSLAGPRREGYENRPYAFPDCPDLIPESLTAGCGFLAFQDVEGIPVVADDCMELVRLPIRRRDRVDEISAVGNALYGHCGSLLYEWREPQQPTNASALLKSLLTADRYSCPLNSWTAHIFSISRSLGRTRLLTNSCGNADLSILLAERKGEEYPLELVTTVQQQASGGLSRNSHLTSITSPPLPFIEDSTENVQTFSSVLLRKLQLEQRNLLCEALVAIVKTRLHYATHRIAEYVHLQQIESTARKHAIAQSTLPSVLAKCYNSQLAAAWSALTELQGISHSLQQLQLARQRKEQAAKSVLKCLAKVQSSRHRYAMQVLISANNKVSVRSQELTKGLNAIRRSALKAVCKLQQWTLRRWSNYVIRMHIRSDGVRKLAATLAKAVKNRAIEKVGKWTQRRSQQFDSLSRLLKRTSGKQSHLRLVQCFVRWKSAHFRHRLSQMGRFKAIETSCKAFSGRIRAILKRNVLAPGFRQIALFSRGRRLHATCKLQLKCLSSVLSKARFRSLSLGLNAIFRWRISTSQHAAGLQRFAVLLSSRMRQGLTQLARVAHTAKTQRVFRLAMALVALQTKTQKTCMQAFFRLKAAVGEKSALVSTMGDSRHEDAVTIPGPTDRPLHFPSEFLQKLKLPGRWDSLTDRKDYCCPEDTPSFLIREQDSFESSLVPAELSRVESPQRYQQPRSVNRSPRQRNSAAVRQRSMSIQKSCKVITSAHTTPSKYSEKRLSKPPWRAPQPTGAARAPIVQIGPRDRGLQYAESLKQRHQENCRRLFSRTADRSMTSPARKPLYALAKTGSDASDGMMTARPLPTALAAACKRRLQTAFQCLRRTTELSDDGALELTWRVSVLAVSLRKPLIRIEKREAWAALTAFLHKSQTTVG